VNVKTFCFVAGLLTFGALSVPALAADCLPGSEEIFRTESETGVICYADNSTPTISISAYTLLQDNDAGGTALYITATMSERGSYAASSVTYSIVGVGSFSVDGSGQVTNLDRMTLTDARQWFSDLRQYREVFARQIMSHRTQGQGLGQGLPEFR